ncbi:GGDEF domain-containing phosphodiesterase [Pseudoalteromonas aurantia]|uniref:GGDEF domain-containing protein n=2 Tax=Pseudoalteromonas TaxID=53246 RepID=A0ABY2W0T7_9GAMM|nr:GGDEF domain-containing phosphodiesterase [Pseudoalteromonas aurantia]TMO58767.1 GGDEF domain-containing protein [Pseudoalteromonas aurantia]TMO77113.1 GGDEF domain-containing protein [Pseudoalteromonas aurantia]
MGSLAVIVLTKAANLRILHALTACISLAILALNLEWLQYFLGLSLLGHILFSLRHNDDSYLFLACFASVIFIVLLGGQILWSWPGVLTVSVVTILYLGQLLALNHIPETVPAKHEVVSDQAHDILGLPDRASLRAAFTEYRVTEPGPAMLVMVRLEGFEQVNLHLGREFGDLLLAQSANRIKQQLQSHDVVAIANGDAMSRVAHLGGLHFVFVCGLSNQKHLHEQLIDDIIRSTLKPFNVGNCTLEVSARASYVNCDEELGQFDNLITCAFLALDSQPNRSVCAYQQQMQITKLEQQARLAELAHIDFRSEFELYFQPVIRHRDGEIEFLELLLRWQHPKQGILAAGQFIEDIRLAGLAVPVAYYVIERAAEIAMALRMDNIYMPLSVNVFGPEMLHEEFIEFLDRILLEHHLLPGDLIIECPSALFMSLDAQGVAMVARLRSIGVRLCVDGFGEAPLILAKLPKLSVDYVKVGRSLTAEHQQQGQFKSVVRGMVEMQQQLNSKVICEGVETQEQLNFVKSLDTFAAQGYFFARPLSSVGMISWLKQWKIEHE